jgi:hypothetical protein
MSIDQSKIQACHRCGATDSTVVKEVVFANGTRHRKKVCSACDAYIAFVPRADNKEEEILLADPRFRDMSRAQLIKRIVEMER